MGYSYSIYGLRDAAREFANRVISGQAHEIVIVFADKQPRIDVISTSTADTPRLSPSCSKFVLLQNNKEGPVPAWSDPQSPVPVRGDVKRAERLMGKALIELSYAQDAFRLLQARLRLQVKDVQDDDAVWDVIADSEYIWDVMDRESECFSGGLGGFVDYKTEFFAELFVEAVEAAYGDLGTLADAVFACS